MKLEDLESLEWPFPWDAIEPKDREHCEAELAREVCSTHVLAGQRVTAVAKDGDDVIYFVHSEPPQIAVVHLTYRHTREIEPAWPSTGIYSTIEDLRASIAEG